MAKPSRALLQARALVEAHVAEVLELKKAKATLEEALGALQIQLEDERRRGDNQVQLRQKDIATLKEAEHKAVEVQRDNDALRDRLHMLTIDKARLEGQLERVREFDPITEQRRYRDGLNSIANVALHTGGEMVSDGHGRVAWYRRG